jgi:saccharopine dehydrogenase (NAD+, L-lysine-forming)
MIYGANGYTGELVARLAVVRGEAPLLAGRDAAAVGALAAELGVAHTAVSLTDAAGLRAALEGVDVVAHCAGPFVHTAAPMLQACLATGTHYLDVTGEVSVFEDVFARHDEAVRAGIVLLPGGGFDVVPTDCLAAMLNAALPGATSLELAFLAGGGTSPGTFKVGLAILAEGALRRVGGQLVPTPMGEPRRVVPFPSGSREVGAFQWGDVSTAYRSTGIGDITVYTRVPRRRRGVGRVGEAALRTLLRLGMTRHMATAIASRKVAGPDANRRARSGVEVWGEVRDGAGEVRTATLTGPNGYALTADAVVREVAYLAAGAGPAGAISPGAHTPSTALGADFVRELDGVTVVDPM